MFTTHLFINIFFLKFHISKKLKIGQEFKDYFRRQLAPINFIQSLKLKILLMNVYSHNEERLQCWYKKIEALGHLKYIKLSPLIYKIWYIMVVK